MPEAEASQSLLTSSTALYGIGALVFLTIIMLFMVLRASFRRDRTAADRIQELTGTAGPESFFDTEGVQSATSRISDLAAPAQEEQRNVLRRKLIQGGFRSPNNLEMFSALRVVLALALPMFLALIFRPDNLLAIMLLVLASAAAGYYIPGIVLSSRVEERQATLLRPFPDALDLLVSSVEAGLALDAAFKRVAEEMESAAPELAKELQLVNHEVAAGVPRIDALRHLDERTGLDDVAALVNVLVQAERFGTSVARALRVHAEMVRVKRMLAAEEEAAKVSPKLTVAMVLFILPCLVIVLIGPAVINVIRILIPTMSGG
ncbi:MAG: type II secretion system F family protein [Alphaproteobacteria bacterium]|nr:type II secretion system F family protein [Alphaproteobacteria bacterium]